MRNSLMIAGALLFLATAMFGQAESTAIKARENSDMDRMRGNSVMINEQKLTAGRSLDLGHVRDQAIEMNQLLTSINADVVNLLKGIRAADLQKKLKRLEKLAKELRQAVE